MNILDEYKNTFAVPEIFVRRESITAKKGMNIVCACAGCGKTSLLHQFSQERKSACISFGAEDNSARRLCELFSGVLNAAGRSCPSGDAYSAAGALAGYLSEEKVLFLADNAELITDAQAAHLMELLARASSDGAFDSVFAGRKVPAYCLPLVLDGKAGMIQPEELAFTRSQTAELMRLYGADCSDRAVSDVWSFTGGWAAAAAVTARAAAEGSSGMSAEKAADASFIYEYAVKNIAGTLGEDLVEYLALTSLFDNTEDEFAREVLMLSDAAQCRGELTRLGIMPRSGSLPPVMRRIFARLVPAERRTQLTQRAADRYISQKRFAEAVKLFESSGNVRAAENILRLYGDRFLHNGEFELIGYCGRIISANGRTDDPKVLGTLAQYYYYSGEHEKMEAAYNMADSMFGRENEYSAYRRLYNGLLRYEKNTKLYSSNVLSAVTYLKGKNLPLPFLYRKELDTLEQITGEGAGGGAKLSIARFGGFSAKVGDTEIQCGTKKGAELIAYMTENGGKPVPRDEILDMLWPSNIPNNAVAMLHNIIYALRKELSVYELENIIMYKNKCYTLDMSRVNVLDRPVLEVCAAVEAKDSAGILRHESVLSSYWGKFMGSTDLRWTDVKKEYYDKCFIEATLILAGHYRSKGNRSKELELLKNALALDPYSENIMHDILLCYFALGKPDKAKKIYEDYSELIDEEFGIRPSKWLKSEFLSCFSSDE